MSAARRRWRVAAPSARSTSAERISEIPPPLHVPSSAAAAVPATPHPTWPGPSRRLRRQLRRVSCGLGQPGRPLVVEVRQASASSGFRHTRGLWARSAASGRCRYQRGGVTALSLRERARVRAAYGSDRPHRGRINVPRPRPIDRAGELQHLGLRPLRRVQPAVPKVVQLLGGRRRSPRTDPTSAPETETSRNKWSACNVAAVSRRVPVSSAQRRWSTRVENAEESSRPIAQTRSPSVRLITLEYHRQTKCSRALSHCDVSSTRVAIADRKSSPVRPCSHQFSRRDLSLFPKRTGFTLSSMIRNGASCSRAPPISLGAKSITQRSLNCFTMSVPFSDGRKTSELGSPLGLGD